MLELVNIKIVILELVMIKLLCLNLWWSKLLSLTAHTLSAKKWARILCLVQVLHLAKLFASIKWRHEQSSIPILIKMCCHFYRSMYCHLLQFCRCTAIFWRCPAIFCNFADVSYFAGALPSFVGVLPSFVGGLPSFVGVMVKWTGSY